VWSCMTYFNVNLDARPTACCLLQTQWQIAYTSIVYILYPSLGRVSKRQLTKKYLRLPFRALLIGLRCQCQVCILCVSPLCILKLASNTSFTPLYNILHVFVGNLYFRCNDVQNCAIDIDVVHNLL
jgi:hypothetical protein